ncbi:Metallo-dependent phosphatase [Zopfia rhizophila CBS 207.26]|uniref:Metallo-dependent phosphatase n=1 Tax=Zopfia rhizophila CBS 207.26 TaxID=1314779 RepID=A0A6A6DC26_9PEZI|nr:Metallo-dependent phosphatase [Zopfia rhizophila CBS 207.26]
MAGLLKRLAIAASLSSPLLTSAEEVLYSKRALQKRQLQGGNYNISYFHINDVHAHLDDFSSSGTNCTRPERGCYGGYARVKHVIDEQRPLSNNSLFLNVGDEFQGTLYYTFYGGEKIAEAINQLGFDAMTLGNHEFDAGDDHLGDFLENLTFPIISANIQSTHPVLNKTIKPYHIFEEHQIAVMGVTTEETPSISKPGDGTTFGNSVEAVQNTINHIRETTNITRIAAITHIGYEKDQELAEATTGLFLIIGGHSHTPLGNFEGAKGPYPTIKENKDGDEVFIVTAYRWGEYLGYIDVIYDAQGKIVEYHGGPIHLTNKTEQDADLQRQIEAWAQPFEEFAAEVLGESLVELDQTTCQQKECLLGDFMADAMLVYRQNNSNSSGAGTAGFALINAGGIRATIDAGSITRGEVLTSFPFGNAIVELELSGQEVWDVLEGIVTGVNVNNSKEVTSFFQISRGIAVEYNPENNNGSKLMRVTVGNEPLDRQKNYRIVTLDFLAGGGDNIFMPFTNFISLDTQDEILVQYIKTQSPVNITLDGRIKEVNGTGNSTDPTATASVPGGKSSETGAAMARSVSWNNVAAGAVASLVGSI